MCLLQPVTTVPMLLLSLRSRHCIVCSIWACIDCTFHSGSPHNVLVIFVCLFTLAFKGLVALTRTVTHTHRHTHTHNTHTHRHTHTHTTHTHRHTHTHTTHTRHTETIQNGRKSLDQVVNKYHQNTDSNNYIHTTETIHNVEKKDKLAKFYSGW